MNDVWFFDPAHVYLDAEINKKKIRHWGTEKPEYHLEKQLHSKKVTVWAALSSHGIVGPFLFEDEDGVVETINSMRYLNVLKGKFIPAGSIGYGTRLETDSFRSGWLTSGLLSHPILAPLTFICRDILRTRSTNPHPESSRVENQH